MFEDQLAKLDAHHLLRHLRVLDSAPGPSGLYQGRPVTVMASNNYLGLATHPELKQAAIAAIEAYGVGAGASRLVAGTMTPHEQLEAGLAHFKQAPAALVFGSGYLANLGLVPAVIGSDGLILADRLCHASLIDACRLSGARFRVYHHGDPAHLERILSRQSPPPRRILIVTEGIFSMDGDVAPLPDLLDLALRYEAHLLVDDAHGTGVMGEHGRGTPEFYKIESRLPFHMGTLSKALGTSGGYIVGEEALIQYLVNSARSFIYTTAPPPALAAAALAALRLVESEPERRARLWDNREFLYRGLRNLGFQLTNTVSPILPVLIGKADLALAFAERLLALGVYAPAIRPPTVPKETSRIRLTVTADHTRPQLDAVIQAFAEVGRALRLL
ncbi:MAG: 8-amino-7-oxononanoate synthase [Nitrospirales bacterium]